jgi:decaprenylphospho-beta-D-erythro-pentofuranosid-2-ulose 2-reductase
VPKPAPITPQRVLILGATSAIAQATARLLAARGAQLFLVARSAPKLEAVCADLRTRGAASAIPYLADLDDTTLHPQILSAATAALGPIDLALLAHGILGDQSQAEQDFNAAGQILYTNFLAPVSLLTLLANDFAARGTGCLAVISSVAGDRGRKSNYVYGASKGGLSIFLEGLRNRVDRLGVHVLTIKPGFVRTPMTAHLPPSPLFAEPRVIGAGILRAVATRQDVVYLPFFWRPILFLIRLIPGGVFKGMNL